MRPITTFIFLLALQGCVLPVIGDRDLSAPSVRTIEPLLFRASDGTLCNAVRIGPDTAATAAHCLDAAGPFVLSGWGPPVPVLGARANPAYGRLDTVSGAAADLAVLRLPWGGAGRVPIAAIRPGPARIVARDPEGRIETRACGYLGRAGGLVELACQIPLGWSGAPVIQDGALVGIVSSRGQGTTRNVTQMADAFRIDSF